MIGMESISKKLRARWQRDRLKVGADCFAYNGTYAGVVQWQNVSFPS
jgi:hypothetical protein